ncbi:hypothetical protein FO440_09760 [Mucilaginibacter corticis]|uniref:Zinc finger CHC2-type domain-containing protein n=1 Tax=Mucilaginibacter corticis TaxID=2597670 RepID=A0A556MWZ3_9SPHI|nr:hypothetical protein FO440_09760 [Mucilaginibacter corticis]
MGGCGFGGLLLISIVKGICVMDMTNEVFSLSRVRELDLNYLLEKLGHEPTARKKNDTDWWYLSPLRNERTASFHIDRVDNEWYDFGLAIGGNPVDFLLRYYNCSVAEMLERLNSSFSTHQLQVFELGLQSELPRTRDRPQYHQDRYVSVTGFRDLMIPG